MAQKFVTGHNGVSYEYLGLAYLSMGMLRVSEICSLSSCLSFFSFTFYICFEGKQLGVRRSRMWNSKLCGRESDNILSLKYTAWKVSKYGVISGPCFPAFRLNTSYLSVFSPNAGKYGPEITPYLDTFHAVSRF